MRSWTKCATTVRYEHRMYRAMAKPEDSPNGKDRKISGSVTTVSFPPRSSGYDVVNLEIAE